MTKPILIEARFRSSLERKVADQLATEGISFEYETKKVPYRVPARDAKYLPDFVLPGTNILLEAKGRFGGWRSDSTGASERQKLVLLKEQHPDLDIRLVFQHAGKPIYKGSKTTYAKWADDHGFTWADKGTVPAAWIESVKEAQSGRGRATR